MTTNTKDAFYAPHAGAFVISCKDLFFLLFGIPTSWFEYASFAAILAPELLAATGIMPILDNV